MGLIMDWHTPSIARTGQIRIVPNVPSGEENTPLA